jgi:hypothetical protein
MFFKPWLLVVFVREDGSEEGVAKKTMKKKTRKMERRTRKK